MPQNELFCNPNGLLQGSSFVKSYTGLDLTFELYHGRKFKRELKGRAAWLPLVFVIKKKIQAKHEQHPSLPSLINALKPLKF